MVALRQLEFWHLPARSQRARGSVTTRPFRLHRLRSASTASTAAARAAQAPVEGATAPMAGEPRARKRAASTSSCPDQLVRGAAVPSLSPGAKRMGPAHPLAPSPNPTTRPRADVDKGRRARRARRSRAETRTAAPLAEASTGARCDVTGPGVCLLRGRGRSPRSTRYPYTDCSQSTVKQGVSRATVKVLYQHPLSVMSFLPFVDIRCPRKAGVARVSSAVSPLCHRHHPVALAHRPPGAARVQPDRAHHHPPTRAKCSLRPSAVMAPASG